jgi:hypothetical protein
MQPLEPVTPNIERGSHRRFAGLFKIGA